MGFYAFCFSECTSEGLQCKFNDKGKTAKKNYLEKQVLDTVFS